jgi:hypothetical protein
MRASQRKGQRGLLWLISLLLVAGLACAQAGEVLTPEEATERARNPVVTNGDSDVEGDYAVGESATLVGEGFLINLLDQPGGRITGGQARGATVTIEQIAEAEDGEIWYRVQSSGSGGWVRGENLEPAEGEGETAEGDSEDTTGGEGAGGAEFQPDDTVYLTGVGFLINLLDQPGGRIVAGQERGATVTVLDSAQQDGVVWYRVRAAGGEGWVSEENVTAEAP